MTQRIIRKLFYLSLTFQKEASPWECDAPGCPVSVDSGVQGPRFMGVSKGKTIDFHIQHEVASFLGNCLGRHGSDRAKGSPPHFPKSPLTLNGSPSLSPSGFSPPGPVAWGGESRGCHGPPPGGAAYSQRLPSNSGKGDLAHEDRAGGGKKKKKKKAAGWNWGVDAEDAVTLETAAGSLATYHGLLLGWDLRLVESLLCGVLCLSGGRQREKPLRRMLCGGDVCWRPHLTCTAT